MLVISSFLTKNKPEIIECFQVIPDFMTLAGYTSHTKKLLQHMSHALI